MWRALRGMGRQGRNVTKVVPIRRLSLITLSFLLSHHFVQFSSFPSKTHAVCQEIHGDGDMEHDAIPRGVTAQTASGECLRVREVWEHNLEEEMELLQSVVDEYPYVAVNTQFPGVVVCLIGGYKDTPEYQYLTVKLNVDLLKLIQLGLTFTDADGALPVVDGELSVWQFNFRHGL